MKNQHFNFNLKEKSQKNKFVSKKILSLCLIFFNIENQKIKRNINCFNI